MSRIAFIGIGAMGEPMAANLLRKGFGVAAMKHRRPEPAERLRAQGARIGNTPAAVAADSDIVFLSLPTSREVEEVVLGRDGVLETVRAGTIVVDCSTSDPASTRNLAKLLKEKRAGLVDAPVTRGVAGAKQGTLAFFLGGDESDIAKVKPALEALGNTFIHLGPVSHAHTAKIISNVLSYSTVALVNEALMLGGKSGVDPAVLFKALMEGAPSKALEAFGPRIMNGEYDPPRVTIDHVCDDMMLVQTLAAALRAPLFGVGAAQEVYRLVQSQGNGARDMSIVAELWRTTR